MQGLLRPAQHLWVFITTRVIASSCEGEVTVLVQVGDMSAAVVSGADGDG